VGGARGRGKLLPKIPSSSEAELLLVLPSGEVEVEGATVEVVMVTAGWLEEEGPGREEEEQVYVGEDIRLITVTGEGVESPF